MQATIQCIDLLFFAMLEKMFFVFFPEQIPSVQFRAFNLLVFACSSTFQ